jgi:hypothetical protein
MKEKTQIGKASRDWTRMNTRLCVCKDALKKQIAMLECGEIRQIRPFTGPSPAV